MTRSACKVLIPGDSSKSNEQSRKNLFEVRTKAFKTSHARNCATCGPGNEGTLCQITAPISALNPLGAASSETPFTLWEKRWIWQPYRCASRSTNSASARSVPWERSTNGDTTASRKSADPMKICLRRAGCGIKLRGKGELRQTE